MGPPRKRRRLSPFSESPNDMSLLEPQPTLAHFVSDLAYTPTATSSLDATRRIEEVHLQIQERSIVLDHGAQAWHQRRQVTGLAEVITTIDAAGNTIISTLTAGLDAGAATSTTPTLPANTTTSTLPTDTSTTDTTTSATASGSTGQATTSGGHVSAAAGSTNSTSVRSTGHHSTDKTGLSPVTLATLTNHVVKTLTRSDRPYVTTFADGEVKTVCDRAGQCRLISHETTSHSTQLLSSTSSTSPSSDAPVGGLGATPSTANPAASSSSSASQQHSDNNSTPPPATIAGGVVGGAAGLAVILLLALIFLRWYKRRNQLGHHALPRTSSTSPEPPGQLSSTHPNMVERAGLAPLVNVLPPLFRHQNRSREEPSPAERGFTKISGRKLPSAFSEGMVREDMNSSDTPPWNVPANSSERDFNNTSFYRDSSGFYGGDGTPDGELSTSPEPGQVSEQDHDPTIMTLSPGPQRTPTIHAGGPYVMSSDSPSSPYTPTGQARYPYPAGAVLTPYTSGRSETPVLGRSETPSTIGDNRSSRFTEDV